MTCFFHGRGASNSPIPPYIQWGKWQTVQLLLPLWISLLLVKHLGWLARVAISTVQYVSASTSPLYWEQILKTGQNGTISHCKNMLRHGRMLPHQQNRTRSLWSMGPSGQSSGACHIGTLPISWSLIQWCSRGAHPHLFSQNTWLDDSVSIDSSTSHSSIHTWLHTC